MGIGLFTNSKKWHQLIFYLFIIQFLITANTTSSHITSEKEDRYLAFSPTITYSEINQQRMHIGFRFEQFNITTIQRSFIFDPILVNLQIYNEPPSGLDDKIFTARELKIELLTTFYILHEGSYQEFNCSSQPVVQRDLELIDFTTVIDPTIYFSDLWGIYDNSSVIEILRDMLEYKINVNFELKFS